MARIAIVEDRPEISSGLAYIISLHKGFTSKVFTTGEAALNGISASEFDVVLMDIQLPSMSGIECTYHLKQKYPELKILMCTVFEDDDKIFRAIAAGASGYILKRMEPELVIRSINELLANGAPMSSSIAHKVLVAFRKLIPNDLHKSPLSEREQEVLSLLASGCRNKDVADNLNISIATVKSHVYSIYQKLHVTSKIEAINKFRTQSEK
jgi:DNA-binding NarL/FixJ family response regulator